MIIPSPSLPAAHARQAPDDRQPPPARKTKAAAVLGIPFRALRYKLKKLGID